MKKIVLALLVLATVGTAAPAASQMNEAGVHAAVTSLFDAMRGADGPAAAALFHEDARLHSVVMGPGESTRLASSPISGFVQAVGTPRDEVWDERISDVVIQIDGGLASAWMNYAFYVDENFSHCGVNAFQFAYLDGAWKILQITDTRRQGGCEMP